MQMTSPIIRLLVFVQFSGVRLGLVGSVGEPNLDKIVIIVKVMTIGGNKTVAVSKSVTDFFVNLILWWKKVCDRHQSLSW